MYKYRPNKQEKEYQQKQREIRSSIDAFVCYAEDCEVITNTVAHRISQSDVNIKKYGWFVIWHNFNFCISCNPHNSALNIGMKDIKCNRLVELIRQRGNERLTSEEISKIIEGE